MIIRIKLSDVKFVRAKPTERENAPVGGMTVYMKDGSKRKYNETFLRDHDVIFYKDK